MVGVDKFTQFKSILNMQFENLTTPRFNISGVGSLMSISRFSDSKSSKFCLFLLVK